jgi:geranylgeranyl diphosphate synthase type II
VKDDLPSYARAVAREVERFLKGALGRLGRRSPGRLVEAMAYSLFSGGKRIRPVMVCATAEAFGGRRPAAWPAAAALELVHTYSLVHDDLPAMDNDDLRRGRPTNHKVYGDAMAILAGDALQTAAFEVLAAGGGGAAQVLELARAAGAAGMVGGQVMDLDGRRIRRPGDLVAVWEKKTAALFEAAGRLGARAAGASEAAVERAGRFGRAVGLAFQATDDILDASQDSALDAAVEREAASFPNRFGMEAARREAARRCRAARRAVPVRGPRAARLLQIVGFIETRKT